MGEYRHKVAAHRVPTGVVTRAHWFGATEFRTLLAEHHHDVTRRGESSAR
jgi:hypothetical protein